jgi:alkylated DNA repair dioxygenase AlkB
VTPDYIPQFMSKGVADKWMQRLWAELPWEQRDGAPRRECWFNPFDMPYTYGTGEFARTYEAHPLGLTESCSDMGKVLWYLMNGISTAYGACFDCCFVNGYEHGRQHLGWHADDSPEMEHDHPIAVVSLGSEREIWFRPKGDNSGENVTKQLLGHGSLLVMPAGFQREYQHRIPKSSVADCGPRLSLTYRKLSAFAFDRHFA